MHIPDYRAADKHVFCRALQYITISHISLKSNHSSPYLHSPLAALRVTYQMRPPHLIHGLCVIELDIQVLVDALEGAADLDFVFEFDGDFLLDERFEETIRG
jgi:hypothetical protein